MRSHLLVRGFMVSCIIDWHIRVSDRMPSPSDLRAAQVKVIFLLPSHFNCQYSQPLAYVEWFTPFHAVDPSSGLMSISRSTRMHRRFGEVIPLDQIVRSCHLVPQFGRVKDPQWTWENVAELCEVFWVNHYMDLHFFVMFVLNRRGCT